MLRPSDICKSIFLLILSTSCLALYGQTITGNIGGTVTDPSGANIAGAKVTATNVDTNVAVSTVSNNDGIYSIRFLQIGKYTVATESTGFTTQTFGPFALEIGQTAKIDVKLIVGGSNVKVDVTSTLAPLLNTEDGTIATVISANTIQNMPLNGRNFSSLTLFLPGAVTTEPGGFTGSNAIERNTGSSGQASINGNRNQTNNYLLDGVEINETINNLIGYNPNPDALGEVKIISANAPAEYGNVNGGDVIALTKSGTNAFHGSASAFLENYNLDANTWSNKNRPNRADILPRNTFTQTLFSGTLGGPIKRDRLFFFVDYSGSRRHTGGLGLASVLTAKMRTGDFSELLDPTIICGGSCGTSTSRLTQLYDPNNGFKPYTNNQGVSILNPAAKYLVAHPEIYPLPNITPSAGSATSNNYSAPTKFNVYNDQFDAKVDWTPTQADRISVRYLQSTAGDATVNALAIGFPGANTYPSKGLAVNYVRTFTPNLINEFRGGFTRVRWIQGNPTDTTGVFGLKGNSVLGIPGSQALPGFSGLQISGLTTLGNQAGGTNFIDNIFTYTDNLTWQHGKHIIKGGTQLIRYQQNNFYPGNDGANGFFQYNGNFTSNPNVGTTNGAIPGARGFSGADFLLDRTYMVGIGGVTGRTGQRQWRSAFFIQDDWKAMPNLTLNLGVRYEYDQPIYEVNNKQANVDLATGKVLLAGVNGASRALYDPNYNNIMPRIGFAYQPLSRFVIRGGYGITTYLEGTGANLRLTFNPPFQSSFEITGTPPTATSPGVSFSTANGFSSANNPNFGGTTYRAWDKNLKPSFIGEYSLTTEYQLNNFSSLKVGYVGESGQHLIQAVAANQLRQPCVLNGVLQSNPNSTACAAANPAPYQALVTQNGSVVRTATSGMMNYNALQVSYRQRATKGLEYTVNYTYARAMTNTVGFFGVPSISGASPYAENAYNNTAEYGPAGQDVRHNLNGTAIYALPFGRGQAYGGNMNYFTNLLAGGWKISATAIAYTGFPVTINALQNNAFTNNKAQRPDHPGKLVYGPKSVNNGFYWWGNQSAQAAYVQPQNGTYGNAAVGSERGPGFQQYDFSFFKDFAIYREHNIGFRADAFNAFNISSYGNPNNQQGDPNFGQITSVRSVNRQIQFSAKYQF